MNTIEATPLSQRFIRDQAFDSAERKSWTTLLKIGANGS